MTTIVADGKNPLVIKGGKMLGELKDYRHNILGTLQKALPFEGSNWMSERNSNLVPGGRPLEPELAMPVDVGIPKESATKAEPIIESGTESSATTTTKIPSITISQKSKRGKKKK